MSDGIYIIVGTVIGLFLLFFVLGIVKAIIIESYRVIAAMVIVIIVAPATISANKAFKFVKTVNYDSDYKIVEKMREAILKDMKISADAYAQYPGETILAHRLASFFE